MFIFLSSSVSQYDNFHVKNLWAVLSSNHYFTQTIYTLEPVVLSAGSSSLLPSVFHPYITFPIASGHSARWQSRHPPSVHPANDNTLPFEYFFFPFSCQISSPFLLNLLFLDFLKCNLFIFKQCFNFTCMQLASVHILYNMITLTCS